MRNSSWKRLQGGMGKITDQPSAMIELAQEFAGVGPAVRIIAPAPQLWRDFPHPASFSRSSRAPAQSQGIGIPLHRRQAERNVLVHRNAKFRGAGQNILPVDAAREGLVFHFLSDSCHIHVKNRLCGFYQGAGSQKTGELITGKESLIEMR